MSHWRPDSVLCGFNRAPGGTWAALPPDFAVVMRIGLDIAARSGGAFDPTIGALVDLCGFGPMAVTAPPTDDQIAQARSRSGWKRTTFDAATGRLRQPGGLSLDLSGIAKGYAVDAIAALLADHGVHHCLVEIGGELAGRGLKPDGEPWWVDLENPGTGTLPPFRAALHQWAVATSGDYVRGAHNLDPVSGRPATHDVVSVTVFHASAMQADAWASALTVLGPKDGLALAARESLAARMVTRSDAGLAEMLTPALRDLI
jgi:thiamine biosynthesis lipoprotein